jgi:hypothetical protein
VANWPSWPPVAVWCAVCSVWCSHCSLLTTHDGRLSVIAIAIARELPAQWHVVARSTLYIQAGAGACRIPKKGDIPVKTAALASTKEVCHHGGRGGERPGRPLLRWLPVVLGPAWALRVSKPHTIEPINHNHKVQTGVCFVVIDCHARQSLADFGVDTKANSTSVVLW